MAKKEKSSLTEVVSRSLGKTFDLDTFKKSKFLDKSVKFKPQRWIPLSKAFQDVISLPGIPLGHITLLRGHSDTGKTTALLEAAVNAQKMGILPVFIITEMK
jgi:RecA/RadA recombinase